MFIVHTTVSELVDNLISAGVRHFYVQGHSRIVGSPFTRVQFRISITAAAETGGPIFAGHVRVEEIDLFHNGRENRQAAAERAERARHALEHHLLDALGEHVTLRPGILLESGMLADLFNLETQVDGLWRIIQDGDDPRTRQLIIASEERRSKGNG